MKKIKNIILMLFVFLIFISCATAPLTGRRQLKFVSDESVVQSSVAQYNFSLLKKHQASVSTIEKMLYYASKTIKSLLPTVSGRLSLCNGRSHINDLHRVKRLFSLFLLS